MRTGAMLLAFLLAGCATLPYTQMTPQQIEATAKIKDSSFICTHAVYAGATVTTMAVAADKAVPTNMKAGEDCKLEFTSGAPLPPK